MGLWDQLPFDLLNKMDEHLELYQDKVRSKCVCTHWDDALPKLPDLRNQPPWLLLPFASGSLCGLFHPFEKNMFVIDLPEAGEKICVGSDHGWVVTVQLNGSINVVNLLTRARYALPPRYEFTDVLKHRPEKVGHEYLIKDLSLDPDYVPEPPDTVDSERVRNSTIQKIALSCAPTSGGDFRAVAIYCETRRLAYCKLGDKKWMDMVELNDPFTYWDITFCDGKLYALNQELDLMVCDDIVSCPKLRKLLPAWEGFGDVNSETHLINLSDNEIMVVRRIRRLHHLQVQKSELCSECQESKSIECCSECQARKTIHRTYDFQIFKMNPSRSGWMFMKCLANDMILFMGMGRQLCIRGRKLGITGRGNQIYFTDKSVNFNFEHMKDPFDQGIFSFKDKETIESLGYEINNKMIFPSPIWVTPNPY